MAASPLAVDFQAYVVTCSVSGRQYIGITGRTLRQRWKEHVSDAKHRSRKSILGTAIRKYGADKFSIEPVFSAFTWPDLCAVERLLIVQYGTLKPRGYNLSPGGEGCLGAKIPEALSRWIGRTYLPEPQVEAA